MGISATRNGTNDRGSSPTLLFALIAAGLAGNYFNYPLFITIDFLFGSIFALLTLTLCRLGGGAMAAIASYSYIPSAIIIMTTEAASVGLLMERCTAGMALNKNPRSSIGREETP